jgi:hypothetical protein
MKKFALLAFVTLLGPEGRADVITQHQGDPLSQFQGHFAPLVFEKYSGPGTLVGVTLTESASIKNVFSIAFANAATISLSVRESIFGFEPITISRAATSNRAGTTIPQGAFSPFSRTLALNPKDFLGTGAYVIPVDSAATSNFASNDGNGYGSVLTYGRADAILTYRFSAVPDPGPIHVSAVPEPSTCMLAGILGMAGMVGAWWRPKRST